MGFFGEAAARLADGNQAALVVIQSQHEGAEVFARAARIGVSADDAFLPLDDLDLQPFAAALLLITTGTPLGDDAFQPRCAAASNRAVP